LGENIFSELFLLTFNKWSDHGDIFRHFSKGCIMKQYAIGIDIGGTNLKGAVMDKAGEYRHLVRVPTAVQGFLKISLA
jgi:hypothetical protein